MTYERLDDLARREEQLIADGQWAELVLLQAERDAVIAALPAAPSPAERPVLEHALRRSRATERALGVELARVSGQLAALRQGRRAVTAYGSEPSTQLDARG